MQRGNFCFIYWHVRDYIVLPLQSSLPKKKTLLVGLQIVRSDKVSLVTGLLILRISACSNVTFIAGH